MAMSSVRSGAVQLAIGPELECFAQTAAAGQDECGCHGVRSARAGQPDSGEKPVRQRTRGEGTGQSGERQC